MSITMSQVYMLLGFLFAAYSIVGNDALQTLGTFFESNKKRPWWVLWLYAGGIMFAMMTWGWVINAGDPAWGRLQKFPETDYFTWLHVLPPFIILLLTRMGIPVSTTFLVLAVFSPVNMGPMMVKSVAGYIVAFVVAIVIYILVTKKFEKRMLDTADQPPSNSWIALQWVSTGFLWSQWMMHDMANVFVYMPRELSPVWYFCGIGVLLAWLAYIFYGQGGAIQGIVASKTNTNDIRSATIVDFIFGIILLVFKEYSNMPMSTTWVFIGLLTAREIAFTHHFGVRPMKETFKMAARDLAKLALGLGISVVLALGLPPVYDVIHRSGHDLTVGLLFAAFVVAGFFLVKYLKARKADGQPDTDIPAHESPSV